jgi:hypothetical protein
MKLFLFSIIWGIFILGANLDFEIFNTLVEKIGKEAGFSDYHQYLVDKENEIAAVLDKITSISPKSLLFNLNNSVDLFRTVLKFKSVYGSERKESVNVYLLFKPNITMNEYFAFLLQAIGHIRGFTFMLKLKFYSTNQLVFVDSVISANSDLIKILCALSLPFRTPNLNLVFIAISSHVTSLANKSIEAVRDGYLNYFYSILMSWVVDWYVFCVIVEFRPIIDKVEPSFIEKEIEKLPATHQELLPRTNQLFDFITVRLAEVSYTLQKKPPTDKQQWLKLMREARQWKSLMIQLEAKFRVNAAFLQKYQKPHANLRIELCTHKPDDYKELDFQIFTVPGNPDLKPAIYIHDIGEKDLAIMVKAIYVSENFKNLKLFSKKLRRLIKKYFSKGMPLEIDSVAVDSKIEKIFARSL